MTEEDTGGGKALINVQLSDVFGLSKPAQRLLEQVERLCGVAYEPRRIRRIADAEAYRETQLAKAEASNRLLFADTEIEIAQRAARRLAATEIRRQENIEAIVAKSVAKIEEQSNVGSENAPPDDKVISEDWLSRFFDNIKDVNSDEMQKVWASVLARETRKKGSFSYRSLETLGVMQPEEAALFEKFCSLGLFAGRVIKINDASDFKEFGITFSDLLKLRDTGLIHSSDMLTVRIQARDSKISMFIGDKLISLKQAGITEFVFPCQMLTATGLEISALFKASSNEAYFSALTDWLKSKKIEVTMHSTEIKVPQPPSA